MSVFIIGNLWRNPSYRVSISYAKIAQSVDKVPFLLVEFIRVVDDTKAGSIFSPSHPSDDDMKGIKQLFKHALQFPFVEVVEDGVKGREVPREHTPLAPRFDYVHDSIHNVPKRVFSFALLRIQDNFGNLLLFISEVSWILTHDFN